MTIPAVATPIPISRVQNRYLIHSASHAAHVRRTHNITGVLIGNLPQAPQQNVFSGLPLELMPEEARLLIEKGVAYIVDDTAIHRAAFLGDGLSEEERSRFRELLERQGSDAAKVQAQQAEDRKSTALRKIAEKESQAMVGNNGTGVQTTGTKVGNGDMDNWNDMPEGMLAPRSRGAGGRTKSRRRGAERSASSSVGPATRSHSAAGGPPSSGIPTPVNGEARPAGPPRAPSRDNGPPSGPPRPRSRDETATSASEETNNATLFEAPTTSESDSRKGSMTPAQTIQPYGVTPATSNPPLAAQAPSDPPTEVQMPPVPESYAVYKHMHDKGYFLAPGLRFGCQYMAYPGDPLRYHSHFLVNGKGWDEEFPVMEVVAGGRLGTGVKKGFLLGGEEKKEAADVSVAEIEVGVDGIALSPEDKASDGVRTFSIEWAGM